MRVHTFAVVIGYVLTGNVLTLSPAFASGYGLREFSASAMGAAYAGAAATGIDASYQAYNPASISLVERSDFSATVIGIFPDSSASYPTALTSAGTPVSGSATASEFIDDAIIPGLSGRMRLSDKWALGVVAYAPWGLATNYPETSNVRYYARVTKLMTLNITPSVSYQLSPRVALAAGMQIQYMKGTLSNNIDLGTLGAVLLIKGSIPGAQDGSARLTADDWAAGFAVGLIAKPTDRTTIGVSYHSSIDHNLSGSLEYTLDSAGIGAIINAATGMLANTQATVKLSTPDKFSMGLRAEFAPRVTVLAELEWTNWEKFRELRVVAANPAQPDDVTLANWKTTWFGAFGLEYRATDQWSYRAGLGYDESPVPDQTLNPRIPDSHRTTLAVGGTFRINPATSIAFAYEHLFIADRDVSLNPAQAGNALRGTLAGKTQSSVDAVGIQLTHRLN